VTAEGQLREWLDAIAAPGGVVSAVEVVVASTGGFAFRHAAGFRVGGERLGGGAPARFDIASLTKPWMATLGLLLDRDGSPRLSDALPRSGGGAPAGNGATLEDLLRHHAGLPAWTPLAPRLGRRLGEAGALRDFLLGERAGRSGRAGEFHPERGARSTPVYSDLGYVLWGLLAEEAADAPLATLLDERVCGPLGVAALGELARGAEIPDAVECRLDNGREVELAAAQGIALGRQRALLRGVPQDANARTLRAAGISCAHAGLFATADELLALAREWLRPEKLLATAEVERALAGGGEYALGWARQSAEGSSGPALSPAAFGHTGFTGCSLWIDPRRATIFVLLAHRHSSAIDFNPFRREFHRLAAQLPLETLR